MDRAHHCLLEEDMPEPRSVELAEGQATFVSVKSPEREGPNQDAALVLSIDGTRAVMAVADGAGGLPAGAKAARAAVSALLEAVDGAGPEGSVRSAIVDGFERANEAVLDLRVGAATTLAAVELAGREVRAYHVGDSGILIVGQRGRIKLQSVPHSPTGYGVEGGFLDEKEALHHEELSVVLNLVGTPDMRIELGSALRLSAKDTVLVASDGLFDNLHVEEIVETIRVGRLDQAARRLLELCRSRMLEPGPGQPSKPDDVTLILFRPSAGPRRARSAGARGEPRG